MKKCLQIFISITLIFMTFFVHAGEYADSVGRETLYINADDKGRYYYIFCEMGEQHCRWIGCDSGYPMDELTQLRNDLQAQQKVVQGGVAALNIIYLLSLVTVVGKGVRLLKVGPRFLKTGAMAQTLSYKVINFFAEAGITTVGVVAADAALMYLAGESFKKAYASSASEKADQKKTSPSLWGENGIMTRVEKSCTRSLKVS